MRLCIWTADPSGRLALDIDELTDDITFRRRASEFVDNKQNGLTSKWEDVTMDRLLMSSNGKKMLRDGKWHTQLAREYLREVDKFRKLLLFCVYTSARLRNIVSQVQERLCPGPERFSSGRVRDDDDFLQEERGRMGHSESRTAFLLWRIGQPLSLYLVYAQLLAELLSVKFGYGCGWGGYIWGDKKGPWETPRLTSILRQRTGEDIGHALGTLQFRHTAGGIGRQYVGDEFAKGYKYETGEPGQVNALST